MYLYQNLCEAGEWRTLVHTSAPTGRPSVWCLQANFNQPYVVWASAQHTSLLSMTVMFSQMLKNKYIIKNV